MSHIDYLKKEIKKTGYPLEIEISSLLDKKWQFVMNTDTYLDRDEGKLRDIDIYAFDTLGTEKIAPLGLRAGLVIECKKDEDFAWVFFTRPFKFDIENIAGQYIDEAQIITKNVENFQVMEIILGKAPLHYKNMKRIAVSYNEFCLKGKKASYEKKKREIFEAQNQLKKYIDCGIDQLIKAGSELRMYPIEMSFPCIVFDGLMYEAIVENGNLQLEEANHLILDTSYRTPYSVFEKCLLVDVVRKDCFENYLKLIRKDVMLFKRIVSTNSRKITRRIDEIISLLSSTKTRG
jgi:hypothetical protein